MPLDSLVILSLLIFSIFVLAGVMTTKLATRLGVPALVLFIMVGMGLNSFIYFDNAWLAQLVGTAALVIILFDGGLHTGWQNLRPVTVPSAALATLGVIITTIITGLIAWWALGLSMELSMLIGAIVGSTDAAAVFAVVGTQNIRHRVKITAEAESAMNDPMAALLTLLMIDWIRSGPPGFWQTVGFLIWQMGFGLLTGLGLAWVAKRALNRLRMEASGLYPILLVGIAFFTFAATTRLGGSGLVAVYVLGVYIGSSELPYRQSILRFHEGAANLAQITVFTMLGLLVFPAQMVPLAPVGLLIAAGLMLVARPVAVWLCTLGMGYDWREFTLLAWAGLRGAVPVVLATFPLLAGTPQSNIIFNIVFFVVLASALIQGSTIRPLANLLGLVEGAVPTRTVTMDLMAMERVNADLIEVEIVRGAAVTGKKLADLHLPEQVAVSALVRAGRVIVPKGKTRLQVGDVVFVLAARDQAQSVRTIFAGEELSYSD